MNLNLILKKILIYFAVLLIASVQLGISKKLFFHGIVPDLILAFGLSYLLLNDFYRAGVWLIFGGIILDLCSPARFGWITLALIIPILPVYFALLKIIRQTSTIIVLGSFFTVSIFSESLLNLFLKSDFNWQLIFSSLSNSLIGFVVYTIINSQKIRKEPIKL